MKQETQKHKINFVRIIAKILFVFLLSLCVASIYAFRTLDTTKIKDLVEQKISQNTDYELKIKGDLSLGIKGLSPAFFISNLHLKNKKSENSKEILTVKDAQVAVSIFRLLIGQLNVDKVYLKDFTINYVSEKNGDNFTSAKKQENKNHGKNIEFMSLHLSNVYVKNLTINTEEDGKKEQYFIDSLNLSFDLSSSETELDLILFQKKIYRIKIQASSIEDILNQEKDLFLNASLANKDMNLQLEFKISDIKTKSGANLELSGYVDSLKTELALLNIDSYDIPKIEIDSKITGSINDMKINKLDVAVGDSKMNVKGSIKNLETRPNFNLNINAALIHLPKMFNYTDYDYSEEENEIPDYVKEKRNPMVFTDTPLLIDFFNSFDAKVSIDAKELYVMTTMPIENVNINLNLQKGVLLANPISANYAKGKGSIYIKADGSSKEFVDATLYIKGMVSPGLVVEYADGGNYIDPKGMAETSIFLKGKGKDLSELIGSVNGEVKINSVTELKGNNVAEYAFGKDILKSTFDDIFKGKRANDLKIYCVAGNIQLNDGIAVSNRELAAQTDKVNVVVNGIVDFKKETLDVSIVPIPVSSLGIDNSDIISMLKVSGPIAEPSFTFSSENAVKNLVPLAAITTVATVATGGILTLPVLGVGFLANNWIKAITQDPTPCKTAYERTSAEETKDYKPEIDEFLKQFNTENMIQEKGLNEKTNQNVVKKVSDEVIKKPLQKTFNIIKYPFKQIFNY